MTSALFYLLFQSAKNSVRARILRLKRAKYLSSAVVGALYFYFYFYRYLLGGGPRHAASFAAMNAPPALFEVLGALVLAVFVASAWLFPQERTALIFSEPEVAFLFPAPVSRRVLINFKLIKSQSRILLTVLFMSIFSRRFSHGGGWWIHLLGLWTVFSALSLHLLGSSFTRTMLQERGVSRGKQRAIVSTLLLVCLAAVVIWSMRVMPAPVAADFHNLPSFGRYLDQLLASGPLPWLLLPFRLVVRPYFAADAAELARALFLPLVIIVLHYFWVVRSDVAFEEASADASRKIAEKIASFRANRGAWNRKPKKRKRDPFKLSEKGAPWVPLLWKNLIGANQGLSLRQLIVMAVAAIAFAMVFSSSTHNTNIPMISGFISGFLLVMSVFAGSQLIRQDFRQDLPMSDLLKTYPMSGWEVAMGELLAPTVILTGAQWLLIIITASFLSDFGGAKIPSGLRLSLAFAAALVVPPFNIVTLVIPNGATLLFPGWFQSGKRGPQGIEATGQNLIFGVGQMLALVMALVPASAAFAIAFFVARLSVGTFPAIALASVPAALVLAAEAAFGIWFLGRVFDRFDLSEESTSS